LAAAIIFAVGLDRVRARGWLPASARAARHAVSQGPPPGPLGTPGPQGIAAAQGTAPQPAAAAPPAAVPPQRDVPAPDRPGWVRPVIVGAVGLVALLPLLPHLPLPTADNDTPGFFSSQNVHVVPAGAVA